MTRRFYWLEDKEGVVVSHSKHMYKTGLYRLYYTTRIKERPPVGVHGDTWIDANTP